MGRDEHCTMHGQKTSSYFWMISREKCLEMFLNRYNNEMPQEGANDSTKLKCFT